MSTPGAGPVIGGIDIREVASCTCLRLRRVTRRVSRVYDSRLAAVGLTATQFGLLAHLYGAELRPDSGASIGAVAAELGMDPTTLKRTLDRLEQAGFVVSGIAPDDARVRRPGLTAEGRQKLAAAAPLWHQAQAELRRGLGLETTAVVNGLMEVAIHKLGD